MSYNFQKWYRVTVTCNWFLSLYILQYCQNTLHWNISSPKIYNIVKDKLSSVLIRNCKSAPNIGNTSEIQKMVKTINIIHLNTHSIKKWQDHFQSSCIYSFIHWFSFYYRLKIMITQSKLPFFAIFTQLPRLKYNVELCILTDLFGKNNFDLSLHEGSWYYHLPI